MKIWSHTVAITSYVEGNFTKFTTKTYLVKYNLVNLFSCKAHS